MSAGQFGPQFPAGEPHGPTAPPANVPAVQSQQQLEAYPIHDGSRDVLAAWQQFSSGRTDLRVAIDERSGQALVYAPPVIHQQIREQLAAKNVAAQPAAAPTIAASPAVPLGPVTIQLRNMLVGDLHPRIEKLMSRQVPATIDASGQWQSFVVEAAAGIGVTMNVNMQTGQVRIDGPPLQTAAWRSVVEALDSPPQQQGTVTQLVATKPANNERVRKALQTLQTSGNAAPTPGSLAALLFQQEGTAAGQPAATQPTQPATPPAAQAVPTDAQTAIDAARLAEASGGLLGPVQVQFVEGLDIIVLRGSERDVQRVMEIINQIEQLSSVTVPAIEIHPLKHVDSLQLGALLQRLYDPEQGVLGARLGSVSITPLGNPNALLLIGRSENVRMAIELIDRLDQPLVPTARFQVFPLQHASAAEAKTLIDGFLGQLEGQQQEQQQQQQPTGPEGAMPNLAPRALVVADPRTNSLIVSAGPRDLAEIAALVSRIDTPGASAELKVFTVVNGDAEGLANMLRALFGAPAAGGAAATDGGGLGQVGPVRMQFSVDPRTNSIIAAGSREDLAVVEAILLRLDEGDLRERKTSVHKLNNAFAENVAEALNLWLRTERDVEATVEAALSPFEQIEREVIIVPELATNSLIVSATPRFYNDVIRIIRELDERPPMVLIQVLIAEVRLNDTDQFGVELGLQDSLLFDRSLLGELGTIETTVQNQGAGGAVVTTTQQTIVNAPGTPGFDFNNPATGVPLGNNLSDKALAGASNVAAQGLSNFAVNRLDPTLGFSGFVFSASSDAVSVLLRALQEKRRVEVLSRPQLMALDGQPGQVQVGQDVPTVTGVTLNEFGQTNNIVYRSVGLILEVVPRISPDGLVVMQITANKSEVGPENEGIPISFTTTGVPIRAPRIEVSQALTTVSALSGQTVILGGLIQTRKNDIHRRVPIIADIPLIGNLFRYDSVSEERRELLIILTPQIIYNKFDSDLVKQIESSRMSWILSDVINIHGEAGLRSRCDQWGDADCEAVYPTYVPEEGVLPLSPGRANSIEGETLTPYCEPSMEILQPSGAEPLPEPRPSPMIYEDYTSSRRN